MNNRRLCLLDLGAHGEAVNDVSVQTFAGNSIFGTATTELHTVSEHTREIKHDVYGKRQDEIFLFVRTRRNLIYLSSFLVCYQDVSSNFSKV